MGERASMNVCVRHWITAYISLFTSIWEFSTWPPNSYHQVNNTRYNSSVITYHCYLLLWIFLNHSLLFLNSYRAIHLPISKNSSYTLLHLMITKWSLIILLRPTLTPYCTLSVLDITLYNLADDLVTHSPIPYTFPVPRHSNHPN